jgi:hypothetical protein
VYTGPVYSWYIKKSLSHDRLYKKVKNPQDFTACFRYKSQLKIVHLKNTFHDLKGLSGEIEGDLKWYQLIGLPLSSQCFALDFILYGLHL